MNPMWKEGYTTFLVRSLILIIIGMVTDDFLSLYIWVMIDTK